MPFWRCSGQTAAAIRGGCATPAGETMRRVPDRLRAVTYAAALALCAIPPSFSAETAAAPDAAPGRPRIGLALSGGGARGIAHIGVLKVLEEMRVPVHCVTGTSMGSIVGAGFASGSTPARLEERVLKTDWDSVFTDRPPRQEIAQRRKTDDYKTLFAPEYGIKDGGLALPK
jgi:NTE family protein